MERQGQYLGILARREASPGQWGHGAGGIQCSVEGEKEGFLEEAVSQLRPDDKEEPAREREELSGRRDVPHPPPESGSGNG